MYSYYRSQCINLSKVTTKFVKGVRLDSWSIWSNLFIIDGSIVLGEGIVATSLSGNTLDEKRVRLG